MKRHNSVFQQLLKTTEEYILEDQIIRLSYDKGRNDRPTDLRRFKICREEDGKVLVFISNDLKRGAAGIAALYKSRWQIELFFKWIKQNLKVKRFLGRSENAVKIQVLTVMIAYLLLRLAQITIPRKLSLQQIARRISLNLTSRCSLLALFSDPPDSVGVNLLQNQRSLELAYA